MAANGAGPTLRSTPSVLRRHDDRSDHDEEQALVGGIGRVSREALELRSRSPVARVIGGERELEKGIGLGVEDVILPEILARLALAPVNGPTRAEADLGETVRRLLADQGSAIRLDLNLRGVGEGIARCTKIANHHDPAIACRGQGLELKFRLGGERTAAANRGHIHREARMADVDHAVDPAALRHEGDLFKAHDVLDLIGARLAETAAHDVEMIPVGLALLRELVAVGDDIRERALAVATGRKSNDADQRHCREQAFHGRHPFLPPTKEEIGNEEIFPIFYPIFHISNIYILVDTGLFVHCQAVARPARPPGPSMRPDPRSAAQARRPLPEG